jgi:hypothetical protein
MVWVGLDKVERGDVNSTFARTGEISRSDKGELKTTTYGTLSSSDGVNGGTKKSVISLLNAGSCSGELNTIS